MEEFLQNIGVGLRSISDEFFEDSYRACKIFQRKGITVEDDEELCHEVIREFPCYAAGCNATFQTLLDFEMHYNNYHRYVCIECKKALPSPRLLDIHIQEIHDSYFHVLSTTQPMYQCYVSECNLKFNDSVERKNHCTNVHKFPKNFRFDNTPHYVKKEPKDKMDIDDPKHERKEPKTKKVQLSKNQKIKMFPPITRSTNIVKSNFNENQSCSSNSIVGASSLTFIPRQIQKSYTKALTNNQSNEKNVLETETMMDLAESLPT